ncbi:MAG: RNA polymerase sigma factor [Acidobacteria bacterium]|uniref:RNA polymerase sigma factor n=1 Tax=Candidatus Polarisedimenticola svalbardensis TaxID=2886004 RepID=A0A8J7CLE6_9BACT|nr:RNA polymerase sigma factor [Candidatus Polarisedimenticola svalbardensis]
MEAAKSAPEGDMRAFERLVRLYEGRVKANCRHLTRSIDDAEDLTQEVFVKAFFGISRFEGRASFKTWIQRIKVNHCLNFLKKKEGKTFVPFGEPGEGEPEPAVEPVAEQQVESGEARQTIAVILDELPDTLRIPLVMCDVDQFSYQEIADTLGIGLSAAKMRIKRGREEFRKRFGSREQTVPAEG